MMPAPNTLPAGVIIAIAGVDDSARADLARSLLLALPPALAFDVMSGVTADFSAAAARASHNDFEKEC